MERVEVTRPIIGFCNMQVCAVKDATDEEILKVCNSQNPSGTDLGWAKVIRKQNELKQGPVQCESHSDRLHFIIEC
jgi:hypothetical protein